MYSKLGKRSRDYGVPRRSNSAKWDMRNRLELSTVRTNCFRLLPTGLLSQKKNRQQTQCEWHEYQVEIFPLRRVIVKDEHGITKETFEKKTRKNIAFQEDGTTPVEMEEPVKVRCEKSSPLTRRIMKQLQTLLLDSNPQRLIVSDGAEKAYASFYRREPMEYNVTVPRQCGEDDPDKQLIKLQDFCVVLRWKLAITLGTDGLKIIDTTQSLQFQEVEAIINTALRSGLLTTLKAYKMAPKKFFLPMQFQSNQNIVGRAVAKTVSTAYKPKAAVAVKASASVTQNGQLLFSANLSVGGLLPNGRTPRERLPRGIKLLSVAHSTFVGVKLPSLKQVVPHDRRKEIEQRLKGYTMELYYERPTFWQEKLRISDERIAYETHLSHLTSHPTYPEMRGEGKAETWIEEKKYCVQKGLKLDRRDAHDGNIVWTPSGFTFPFLDDDVTVEEYYWKRYGYKLEYPEMPLIRVSQQEYIPAEFLYQGEDEAPRDNLDGLKDDALAFNDCFSGTKRIEKINEALIGANGGPDINSGLLTSFEALGLEGTTEPLSFPANVLSPPLLEFKDAPPINEIPDGSWQMQGKKFANPSCIYNYGVVHHPSVDEGEMADMFHNMGQACKKAGMSSESQVFRDWNRVKVPLDWNPMMWRRSFEDVRDKARRHFLPFKSALVRNRWTEEKAHRVRECLLLPSDSDTDTEFQAIPLDGEAFFAFDVRDNSKSALVKAAFQSKNGEPLRGPFSARFELDTRSGKLLYDSNEITVIFTVVEGKHAGLWMEALVEATGPLVHLSQVSCPSIVFVALPEKCSAAKYDELKRISEHVLGTQSQIICMDKYNSPKGGGMAYIGNIAMKLNTKLANTANRGSAWRLHRSTSRVSSGTMLIGYTMTPEAGQSGIMVVSAACTLEDGELRFGHATRAQSKSPLVAPKVLKDILRSMIAHYYVASNNTKPSRIVVYRNGGNDGQFDDIIKREVNALKEALLGQGSSLTFVVAQAHHNLVVVPDLMKPWTRYFDEDESMFYYHNMDTGQTVWEKPVVPGNVPSGCYIDDPSFIPKGRLNESHDFLLTAHGGLKGTSKPVLYRCLHNDNPQDFCKNDLITTTYESSFLYGTASKSIREPSVLRYAARQGGRALSVILNRKHELQQHADTDTAIYKWRDKSTFEIMENFASVATLNERCASTGKCANGMGIVQVPFFTNLAA